MVSVDMRVEIDGAISDAEALRIARAIEHVLEHDSKDDWRLKATRDRQRKDTRGGDYTAQEHVLVANIIR